MKKMKRAGTEWKIVQAAMEIIVEKGLASVSMAMIARRARTGMGAIYHHFPTKEELINNIYTKIRDLQNPVKVNDPVDQKTEDFFLSFSNHYLSFFIHRPREFFLFMDQCEQSPIISDNSKQLDERSFWPLVEVLAKGQREKLIKNDLPATALAYFVKGALDGFLRWFFTRYKDEYVISPLELTRTIWDGIKCPLEIGQ